MQKKTLFYCTGLTPCVPKGVTKYEHKVCSQHLNFGCSALVSPLGDGRGGPGANKESFYVCDNMVYTLSLLLDKMICSFATQPI